MSVQNSDFKPIDPQIAPQSAKLSKDELIQKGKGNTNVGLKLINGLFGKIDSVKEYVNEKFYKKGVKRLQQENWKFAKEQFSPHGKLEKNELKKIVREVAEDEKLEEKTEHFKKMQQWRMKLDLKSEIEQEPTVALDLVKTSHWINDLAKERQIESNTLLEEGDIAESLHHLNEMKKLTRVKKEDFIKLVNKAGGENQLLNEGTVKSVKEVLDFVDENPLIEKRTELKSNPSVLLPAVKQYNEAEKKADDLKLRGVFDDLSTSLQGVSDQDFPQKMERFGQEMSNFLSCFEGDVSLSGVEDKDVLELYGFFKNEIKVTDSTDNLKEIASKFKQRIKGEGVRETLIQLRKEKEASESLLGDVTETFASFFKGAFDTSSHIDLPPKAEPLTKTERDNFGSWLSAVGMNPKDRDKVLTFLEEISQKNCYDGAILIKGLKQEFQEKGLEQTLNELFPFFSMPFTLTDGEKALLSRCFSLQVEDLMTTAVGEEEMATPAFERLRDGLTALFKNQDQVIDRKTLLYAGDLIDFAAHLGQAGFPVNEILRQITLNSKSLYQLDLDKEVEETRIPDTLKLTIIKKLEVKQAELMERAKKSETVQKIISNPVDLGGAFVSSFITTLFPNVKGLDMVKIQKEFSSFGPLLNPIVGKLLEKVDPLYLNIGASVVKGYKGDLSGISPIIDVKKTIREGIESPEFINSVLEAHVLYKRAKQSDVDLKMASDAYVRHLGGTPRQRELILDLDKLSEFMTTLQSINRFGGVTGAASLVSGALSLFSGTISNYVAERFLNKNPNLSQEEKAQLKESTNNLIKTLSPIIPALLKKHNIDFYAQFVTDLNKMIQSDEEIDEEILREKINAVVSQLLDVELDQYVDSVSAGLQSVGDTLKS